jgi:hypothetical protein
MSSALPESTSPACESEEDFRRAIVKKILHAVAFVCLAIAAQAQNLTTVTGSLVKDLGNNLLGSGQVCFLATDANDIPVSFQAGGGGQVVRRPYCSPVTVGVITSFTVPNPALTVPAGINYRVTVKDTTLGSATNGQEILRYKNVSFVGAGFNFDAYGPTIGNVVPLTGTSTSGSLAVNGDLSVTGSFNLANIASIRIANNFAGGDLGAQINAADADLGANPGQIWAFGGGAITTQIVVSSKHVLHLFSGSYTNALGLRIPVIRLQDNSSLLGEGVQTIVQESSNAANTTPVIVCAYDLGSTCATLTPSTANIHISGIHFQGANPNAGTSLIDSVSLGNCLQCSVTDNWFDTIKSSHVLIGGTSGSGFWSDGFEISRNYFSGAQNCSICVINGQNASIHDNYWTLHGNGAAADIDIEPNSTTDHAQDIDIHDNMFDESLALQTVYCVTMQNGQFVAMGRVKIHDNHCDGGPFTTFGNVGPTGTFKLTQCFGAGPGSVNTMSDVEIYNNTCRVTVQGGISLVGVNRGSIHDNIVQCTNDYAISLAGSVTNSTVERNKVMTVTSPNSCGQNAKGTYLSSTVAETNASNANNIFSNNIATATVLNGTGSKVINAPLPDGSGQAFHVPVGLGAGAQGGVQLVALTAPTLSGTGVFSGSCVLSSATYFWKVRAVSAAGGMGVPSNEVSLLAGGGNGCKTLLWTKVAGAASYNIYRSTTTNTEQLIASVSDGSVRYDDLGGQTPTTSIDNNDSSVEVAGAESTPPAGIASSDIIWPDSAAHCWKMNNNNAGGSCIAGLGFAQTWTALQTFSAGIAPFTTTDITVNQAANGDNLFFGQRATDSSPTGNLIYFKNQANNADLFKLDITGQMFHSNHDLFSTDNTFDLGAHLANRPRSLYYGTQLLAPDGSAVRLRSASTATPTMDSGVTRAASSGVQPAPTSIASTLPVASASIPTSADPSAGIYFDNTLGTNVANIERDSTSGGIVFNLATGDMVFLGGGGAGNFVFAPQNNKDGFLLAPSGHGWKFGTGVSSSGATVKANFDSSGKWTQMNGVTLAGIGTPYGVADSRSTAQTAAVASVATFTASAALAPLRELGLVLLCAFSFPPRAAMQRGQISCVSGCLLQRVFFGHWECFMVPKRAPCAVPKKATCWLDKATRWL